MDPPELKGSMVTLAQNGQNKARAMIGLDIHQSKKKVKTLFVESSAQDRDSADEL